MKPIVSIVGRPNVGKSTLFNALVGRRQAIIADFPGTTRDRQYGECLWNGRTFTLADTGGVMEKQTTTDVISQQLLQQVHQAVEESDIILFCVDGRSELTAEDDEAARLIRESGKEVLFLATKIDHENHEANLLDLYSLGFGEPMVISVHTSRGTGDLLDQVVELLAQKKCFQTSVIEEDDNAIRIAIVGRPNVGKSTLVNRMLGYERVVVSSVAGTTIDAVDTVMEHEGQRYTLIDTAGIRRRGKIEQGVEKYSVLRAGQAIRRAEVVFVLIDAMEGLTKQDMHLIGKVVEEGKSLALVLNKWDLAKEKATEEGMAKDQLVKEYQRVLKEVLGFVDYVPIQTISALKGIRVKKLLELAQHLDNERSRELTNQQLLQVFDTPLVRRSPPQIRGVSLRIFRYYQSDVRPPTLTFVVNDPQIMHFSYERYLLNTLRQVYPFVGTPVRIVLKKRAKKWEEKS